MAHPFFDEHIKDFGPRTPEAEKPADGGACVPYVPGVVWSWKGDGWVHDGSVA